MKTDVALVALSTLEQDARTLNLARALHDVGLSVTIVAASTGAEHPFTVVRWDDPGGPARRRWSSLHRFVRSLDLDARIVAGMDLFALGPARFVTRHSSRAALVYDMREFYYALGPLLGKGLKQKVLEIYERRLLRSVDRVIVSAPLDAEVVQLHYALRETPTVVMNTPPFKAPVESTALRDRFRIPADNAIVVYQGVVHQGRGIAPFLKAMEHLQDVHLCIVGDGPAARDLEATASELGVGARVHWYGGIPYDELHAVTCSADIGLCLIEPVSQSYEYALPNKLFEYMMAGIPSLVTDLPALRKQIQEIPAGVVVGKGLTPSEIIDAVQRLRVPATHEAMRMAATAVRALSYDQQARIAVDLFRELL